MGLFDNDSGDKTLKWMKKEAEAARKAEEARKKEIQEGKAKIDTAFEGFNPAFYDARKQSYLNYYTPQLQNALKTEGDQLTFGLSRAGQLRSSTAADKTAKLNNAYDLKAAQLQADGDNSAAQLRSDIEDQRGTLINQLYTTGDQTQAANAALASTKIFQQQQPSYSTLGDVFAGVTGQIGGAMNAYNSGRYAQNFNSALNGYNPSTALRGSSGRVVK